MNKMNGFSSIGMVMLLLLCGGLMLGGLQLQLNLQRAAAVSESAAIKAFVQAEAALSWGIHQPWQPTASWQCRLTDLAFSRACVLMTARNRVMLAGVGGEGQKTVTLWQAAAYEQGIIVPLPHRWSDFCSFKEALRCKLP